MSSNVLASKDINATMAEINESGKDVKSLEYHRKILQSQLASGDAKCEYISPSDNIMSPCSKKINNLRNKQVNKITPKSLFMKNKSPASSESQTGSAPGGFSEAAEKGS